jgi:hypothetical protein
LVPAAKAEFQRWQSNGATPEPVGIEEEPVVTDDNTPQIIKNKKFGDAQRDAVLTLEQAKTSLKVVPEKSFTSSDGRTRRLDVFTEGSLAGIEVKTGKVSLAKLVRAELEKDELLLIEGKVASIEWRFFKNGVGTVSVSGPLRAYLDSLVSRYPGRFTYSVIP